MDDCECDYIIDNDGSVLDAMRFDSSCCNDVTVTAQYSSCVSVD
jgi:hypothetical protein